jgi:hypothetical protein
LYFRIPSPSYFWRANWKTKYSAPTDSILAPYVPSAESHVPFPLLGLKQWVSPSPRPCETFRGMAIFYGEELLASHPNPKMEDHPLSALRDCLFNTFAATLHIWRPFLHSHP